MKTSTYMERATIKGSFKTKVDGTRWATEKMRDGYTVKGPFHNKEFSYTHELPWEAEAEATFTIECSRR